MKRRTVDLDEETDEGFGGRDPPEGDEADSDGDATTAP